MRRFDAVGQRFVGEHEAMVHDLEGDVVHLLRCDVDLIAQHCQRSRCGDETETGARTAAIGDLRRELGEAVVGGPARRIDEADDVVHHGWIDVDVARRFLQREQLARREHGLRDRRMGAHPTDDLDLFVRRRVVDDDAHQEAVALRFG